MKPYHINYFKPCASGFEKPKWIPLTQVPELVRNTPALVYALGYFKNYEELLPFIKSKLLPCYIPQVFDIGQSGDDILSYDTKGRGLKGSDVAGPKERLQEHICSLRKGISHEAMYLLFRNAFPYLRNPDGTYNIDSIYACIMRVKSKIKYKGTFVKSAEANLLLNYQLTFDHPPVMNADRYYRCEVKTLLDQIRREEAIRYNGNLPSNLCAKNKESVAAFRQMRALTHNLIPFIDKNEEYTHG